MNYISGKKLPLFSYPKKLAKHLLCLYRDRNADCNSEPLGSELVWPVLWPLRAVSSFPPISYSAFAFNVTSSKLPSLTLPSLRILCVSSYN